MVVRLTTVFLISCALATSQNAEKPEINPIEPTSEISPKKPSVEDAIPDFVKALAPPTIGSFPSGIEVAVSTDQETTKIHVNQGLNHLHGGWEIEASRHFAIAMRTDPNCLLAHWGMVMSLLNSSGENNVARGAAVDRFLDIVDQRKGTPLERGYAYGLIKYLEGGPSAAAIAFHKVADDFKDNIQAKVFAALFGRSGYDETGSATPGQLASEKILLELVDKNPENPVPLNALLSIRSEGADLSLSLPLARKLCQMAPNYPPYFHLLGHYEWRCGEHAKAASAFGRACSHLESWMKTSKATVADCPEWVRAECYRIVCLVSQGDFETAYAASRRIAATPLPSERDSSAGVRLLWWDAKTLPARILLRRGMYGNANEALNSLPTTIETQAIRTKSLAFWWIDGLRLSLEARRLLDEKKLTEAREVINALTHHRETMSKSQQASITGGERSSWNRAFRTLEIIISELRGLLAMASPEKEIGTAYNWFASAADRQRHSTLIHPPVLMTPMQNHVGSYYLAAQRPHDAIEAYQLALVSFPNDITALDGLRNAYSKAGLQEEAENIKTRLDALKNR